MVFKRCLDKAFIGDKWREMAERYKVKNTISA
jgi:hypothetical protein